MLSFFCKILQLNKFEGTVLNNGISIFKFHPKNAKTRHFWSKFKKFYMCTKVCNHTNSRVMISNMKKLFSNSSLKINQSDIFGPKSLDLFVCFVLFFCLFLFFVSFAVIDKLESFDFKYVKYGNNSFLNIQPKTPK